MALTTSLLLSQYRKLEATAHRIAQSPHASTADKNEAWAAANKAWEAVIASKKK